MNNRKLGSIALARSLCYQINGAADDSDDMDGGGYGSVDIAEILSAEVVRLQKALAQEHALHELARLGQEIEQAEPISTNGAMRDARLNVGWGSEQQAEPVAQREWVGLTEFQFAEIYNKWNDTNGSTPWGLNQALEAKLKERNK